MADPTPERKRRRSRGPFGVQGGVAGVLLALIAAVALPTTQSPPPAIAEFAPQAQEQITDAPESQTSDAGEGEGGGLGEGGATTTTVLTPAQMASTTTTAPPREVPRTRKCVGDPPRQTEDPQSPPCVAFFEGDNGGATSKGVTADEIRIVVPANAKYSEAMVSHFNNRFEFYGRKLRIVEFPGGADMVAKAIAVDEEADAFASTTHGDAGGAEYVYYDELARRGIVSANGQPSMVDEPHLQAHHPYEWSYLPGHDVMSRNKADWACEALQGRNAEFADGGYQTRTRTFGLITTIEPDGSAPDLRPMKAALSGCGIDLVREATIVRQSGDDQAGLEEARQIVIDFQLAEVTTVFCQCHTQSSGLYLGTTATSQGWFPEWLIGTYMYQAEDVHVQFWDAAQIENSFGLQWWSKQLIPQDSPWYWAILDGDPNAEFANFYDYYDARWLYNSLLVLASGIQMAGPELTPENFARGLQAARFPNPNPGQAPYWQGTVGFNGDHTFVNDAALVWFDKNAPSSWDSVPGAVCYAKRGVRYSLGSWPSDNAGLFTGPCY